GNGKILYEVTNRGRKLLFAWLHDATSVPADALNDPTRAAHVGNGFALRQGYTLVWSGWDPDAPAANGGMRIRVPVATDGDKPIMRTIRDEFVFGPRVPVASPTAPLSYEPASLDQAQARLTVRAREADAPVEVPAAEWQFRGPRAIALLPDGTAFKPGFIYDFRYVAKDPKVLGIGFAATRDLVAFLRHETADGAGTANPVMAGPKGVRAVLAIGISQAGRYLREHVERGFNRDEAGRRVFDGVLSHIAGAGKMFMNAQFAQPSRTATQHEDHAFPEVTAPFMVLRGGDADPKMMEVNTSTEYWQKGASLLHTDPLAKADVALPENLRIFFIAGTQHGGRAGTASDVGLCRVPRNPHSATPALRALLVSLDAWVTEGTRPPRNRIPQLRDGTLVEAAKLGFPAIPGVEAPRAANQVGPVDNWVDPKRDAASPWVSLVVKVDADGNEMTGVRLPDVAAALGTHTGWNLYAAPELAGELCDRDGLFVPFAVTKAQRDAAKDPRLSLEERYRNRAGWVSYVKAVVYDLLRERLLLKEDADRFVTAAEAADPFKK
ncbi:MAG TPA: alpha/beta hydrolase domain-containing protein, partial [Methylomirabilota bacterium]|nr:alpha/beta hydrolase domain-containing protein [Methylomirabilota bacterium]